MKPKIAVLESTSCSRSWENSGMESKWLSTGGCLVKINDAWYPAARVTILKKEK